MCVQVTPPTKRIADFDDVLCGDQGKRCHLLPELRDQRELDKVTPPVTLFTWLCSVLGRVQLAHAVSFSTVAECGRADA